MCQLNFSHVTKPSREEQIFSKKKEHEDKMD